MDETFVFLLVVVLVAVVTPPAPADVPDIVGVVEFMPPAVMALFGRLEDWESLPPRAPATLDDGCNADAAAALAMVIRGFFFDGGGPSPGITIPHCVCSISWTSWTSTVLLPRCIATRTDCRHIFSKKSSASSSTCSSALLSRAYAGSMLFNKSWTRSPIKGFSAIALNAGVDAAALCCPTSLFSVSVGFADCFPLDALVGEVDINAEGIGCMAFVPGGSVIPPPTVIDELRRAFPGCWCCRGCGRG